MDITERIACIGVGLGHGSQNQGTEDGPSVVYENLKYVKQDFLAKGVELVCDKIISAKECLNVTQIANPALQAKNIIIDVCKRLSHRVVDCIVNGQFPLVIGGDHSVALGSWVGVAEAYFCYSELGIIWIDAHMDAHTFETSISKAIHGMPLALLMGYGDTTILSQILQNKSVISPNHLVLIGTRSFEDGEAMLLKKLGVKIYYIEDVMRHGFQRVFFESVNYLRNRTTRIGVSLDLDVFDPRCIVGTTTKEPNGIMPNEFLDVMQSCAFLREFVGFEIAEYNPYLDQDLSTCNFIKEIISHLK